MNNTIVLIDGENFLFKLEEMNKTTKKSFDLMDISITKLIKDILKQKQHLDVKKIVYYSAKVGFFKETENKSKELISRQRSFKTNLEKQGIEYKFSGFVRVHQLSKKIFEFKEKGVDVGIAVDMITNAYDNKFKNIVLCSSDSDLQPAVRAVRSKGCKVIYLGFKHNPNKGLIYTTNSKILITLQDIVKYSNEK